MTLKHLCVFCGSATGARSGYAAAAKQLAQTMITRRIDLVYGGANVGLMHILAETMLACGGIVTGVMPRSLVEREVAHSSLTEMHIVDDIQERKALMEKMSDGFIALPGGYGTFDELFEVLSWNQLGIIAKPVGLLNTDGFFDPLIRFLDHSVEERFLRQEHRNILLIATDPSLLIDQMESFRPVVAEKWIDRLKEGKI